MWSFLDLSHVFFASHYMEQRFVEALDALLRLAPYLEANDVANELLLTRVRDLLRTGVPSDFHHVQLTEKY